jgi:hypothetical protein
VKKTTKVILLHHSVYIFGKMEYEKVLRVMWRRDDIFITIEDSGAYFNLSRQEGKMVRCSGKKPSSFTFSYGGIYANKLEDILQRWEKDEKWSIGDDSKAFENLFLNLYYLKAVNMLNKEVDLDYYELPHLYPEDENDLYLLPDEDRESLSYAIDNVSLFC